VLTLISVLAGKSISESIAFGFTSILTILALIWLAKITFGNHGAQTWTCRACEREVYAREKPDYRCHNCDSNSWVG
jgi:Zn finger protein HypA/HybF involved in hydrogenase expression